ncbi:MAG: hypothetical protein KJO81_02815 [Gammaproteobacteria bacterium]|nr:hypothetical protein [Gammaproteobacteria bacterium]
MKQHFIKVLLASMLLVIAPLASAIVTAEDAIPEDILSLLPSDDGSSDAASEEAEFLAEFAEDDDSGEALSNADVEVVIMSDDDDASDSTSNSNASTGAGGPAGGNSASSGSNGIQVASLDGIPQDILDLLQEVFGDGDGGDKGDAGNGGDEGDGGDEGGEGISNVITDDLVWQYDETAFNSDFYDRNGNGPALQATITQADLPSMSLRDIRRQGALMYTTPFRHADGHGDGPGINPNDPTTENGSGDGDGILGNTGRPTLQGNGTWLRLNGLDTQTCLECHGVIDNSVIPAILGVGGQAGISASPFFNSRNADIDDSDGNSLEKLGIAAFDGRAINPPKNLGMGGVELAGMEISRRLNRISSLASRLAQRADRRVRLPLVAKGINFGDIIAKRNGDLDTSLVEGVDGDLVIRPFGRKGEFDTIRGFDTGAMAFHIGMQSVDEFGPGDPDGDGIEDELTTGEMSALHIFLTTSERPFQQKLSTDEQRRGKRIFNRIGCTGCHKPTINTRSPVLEYRITGGGVIDPDQEPYFSVDLSSDVPEGARFETNRRGGIKVPIFSDYKRHNMGSRLAESFHALETPDCDNEVSGTEITNCNFITMKLWGLADTAPYLHDGRALTVFEAIAFHGGEAQRVRDRFLGLSKGGQNALLAYLGTLKNPVDPNQDVLNQVQLGPN